MNHSYNLKPQTTLNQKEKQEVKSTRKMSQMRELNPKDNPRFYDVAHEFGLIVDNEVTFSRSERRDKALMKLVNEKLEAEGLV